MLQKFKKLILVSTVAMGLIASTFYGNTDMGSKYSYAAPLAPVSKSPFTDVDKTHWAYAIIVDAYSTKMIGGFPDGTFKPNDKVTREQFMAMITRRMVPDDYEEPANMTSWSDGYYAYANKKNYPLRSKRDAAMTRKEVAELIAGIAGVNYQGDDAIVYLLGHGLAQGKIKGEVSLKSYAGQDYLTRAEALKFIDNAVKGLDSMKDCPFKPSDVKLLPKLPAPVTPPATDVVYDKDGYVSVEFSKKVLAEAHKSMTFTNGKLEGTLPDLPEGLGYRISFYVKYDPKYKVNAKNSQFLSYGIDFKDGQKFSIPVEWSKVTSGTFRIGIVQLKYNAERVWFVREYPSMKLEQYSRD